MIDVRPDLARPDTRDSHSDIDPWKAEGLSRATWYRRSRPTPDGPAGVGAGRKPKIVIPPRGDILRWYCVRTAHDQELAADIELRTAGFVIFNPMLWKPATRARRNGNGTLRLARPARLEPLFKRYGA